MTATVAVSAPTLRYVPIEQLIESTVNVRRSHDEGRHLELVASIRVHGILTPLVVREVAEDGTTWFEVAAGHRRLRAARAAGVVEVPVSVREMDDRTFREVLLTENLQRVDPDPIDEAVSFQRMIEELKYDVPTLASRFGRSETYVRQRLVLTNLSERARVALDAGQIELGHAVLLARASAEKQDEFLTGQLLLSRHMPPVQFRPDAVREDWDTDDYQADEQQGSKRVATDPARTTMSVGELRALMAEKLQPLACVKWDRADAMLVPSAGACTTCAKRTGANPTLFEELDATDDRCPDAACYDSKRLAWLAGRVASVRAQLPNLVLVSTKRSRPQRKFGSEVVLRKDKDWRPTKAKRGATPALVVDADGAEYDPTGHWEKIGTLIDVMRITPEKAATQAATKAGASEKSCYASTELVGAHQQAKNRFLIGVRGVVGAMRASAVPPIDRRSQYFTAELANMLPQFDPNVRAELSRLYCGEDIEDSDFDPDEGERPPLDSLPATVAPADQMLIASIVLARIAPPWFSSYAYGKRDDPEIEASTGAYPIPAALVALAAEVDVDAEMVWSRTISEHFATPPSGATPTHQKRRTRRAKGVTARTDDTTTIDEDDDE